MIEQARFDALKWWKLLSPSKQEELATKVFPHMPWQAVDKSTSMIYRIYKESLGGQRTKYIQRDEVLAYLKEKE